MLNVVEKFVSINGEGSRAGTVAVFVRFKGCNLHCSYCDTQWANVPDVPFTPYTPDELAQWIIAQSIENITLTGGEPLLQNDIAELINLLGEKGFSVEIETNGSIPLDEFSVLPYRPLFTMDHKSPSSGMEDKMCTDNFALLQKDDTVKFVVGSEHDMQTALKIIRQYSLTEKCHVYFSPVFGKINPQEIVSFMLQNHLNKVRLQLQLHKFIWNPNERGV